MAVRPRTDVIQRLVTILIKLAAHLMAMKVGVIAILVPMVVAVLEDAVVPAAVHLLIIGAPFTRHVMVTAVRMELSNHVIRNVAVLAAAAVAEEEAPVEEVVQIFHTQEIVVEEAAETAASAQAEHHIAAVLH